MRLARSVLLIAIALAGSARAGPVSLFDAAAFPERQGLFDAGRAGGAEVRLASLFAGRSAGLFAPVTTGDGPGLPGLAPGVAALLRLIARAEAGPDGYDAVQHGAAQRPDRPPTRMTLARRDFMHNLARIWAGLPTAEGVSHYKGIAGNRATMTWARFETEMARIFPG